MQSWNPDPADIVRAVSGMSAPSSILDDGLPNLSKSMVLQLSQVAQVGGGKVAAPLRLSSGVYFHTKVAQWCIHATSPAVTSSTASSTTEQSTCRQY